MQKPVMVLAFLGLLGANAGATFTSVVTPAGLTSPIVILYDAVGTPLSVNLCAIDDAAGRVCASIVKDSKGNALAVDGVGNLKNSADVLAALKVAMQAARDEIVAFKAKQTTDTTNVKKVLVPVTPADIN